MSSSTYLLSLITLGLLAAALIPRRSKLNVKRVGIDRGFLGLNLTAAKKEFVANGHLLVDEGYHKFQDENFLIQTQDMERLVLSPKYLPELRMLPESKLSQSTALVARWLGDYSGVDIILQNRQHSDVCRVQLTQQLRESSQFLPEMAEELDRSMSQFLETCTSEDYTPIPTYEFIYSMVLSVTSRIFVGLPLAHDQAWLDTVSGYLAEVVATANVLRPWPSVLRPLVRHFVAPKHRMDTILANAEKLLAPAIQERQEREKQTDMLGFLVQTSEFVDPKAVILRLLILTAAALHTSTMVSVHTLYDLCERPEYFEALRTEAGNALNENSGSWQFSTVKKLRRLDSFMKESMRYNQADALAFNRIVKSPITLSSGLTLPRGTFINMAGESMSRDGNYYSNPSVFNGYRFFNADSKTHDPLPIHEFDGIEPGNLAWGSGRQTCPGRWYASAMNKLIIGELLVRCEMKFPEGQGKRPENLYANAVIMPDPTQRLLLRRLR